MANSLKTEDQLIQRERDFHDNWAASVEIRQVLVDEFFEACTAPENRHILQDMGRIRGKKILELGCGAGEASVYFAKHGADVVATDISERMLGLAQQTASQHGVCIGTKSCSATEIDFPNDTYDIVYAANVLHHVDSIERCLRESHRVLKPGGKFYSWDPLAHNPVINVYRRKASKVRSADEYPLRLSDLDLFTEIFTDVNYKYTWFLTLWIFLRFYLIERVDPNAERYWKLILREHQRLQATYDRLERLDRTILHVFPFLRRWCWNVTVVAQK